MKKLMLSLFVVISFVNCTKDLPENVRIYIDISDTKVTKDGCWTSDPSLTWKYYDKTVSRATIKNAIIVEDPNYADYIIRLELINTDRKTEYKYKNNRTYSLSSISVSAQAKLYDHTGTYLAYSTQTCTSTDELKFNEEHNQYYIDESHKNFSDLTAITAYHNTNSFINKINDHKGF